MTLVPVNFASRLVEKFFVGEISSAFVVLRTEQADVMFVCASQSDDMLIVRFAQMPDDLRLRFYEFIIY